MTDDMPEPQPAADEADPVVAPARRRRWKWPLILVTVLVAVPALLFAVWSWIALTYTYSHSDRAGYVQKFGEKGWVCKTWEGELAIVTIPGAAQERWVFSVRDDSVAKVIQELMGNKVALTYDEHRGLPTSCFGDTQYFVSGVRRVPEP